MSKNKHKDGSDAAQTGAPSSELRAPGSSMADAAGDETADLDPKGGVGGQNASAKLADGDGAEPIFADDGDAPLVIDFTLASEVDEDSVRELLSEIALDFTPGGHPTELTAKEIDAELAALGDPLDALRAASDFVNKLKETIQTEAERAAKILAIAIEQRNLTDTAAHKALHRRNELNAEKETRAAVEAEAKPVKVTTKAPKSKSANSK